MSNSSEEIEHLIPKYLDGTATEEERKIVEEWYRTVHQRPLHVPMATATEVQETGEKILGRLKAAINTQESTVVNLSHSRARIRTLTRRWVSGVAAVLIFITGGIFFFQYFRDRLPTTPVKQLTYRTGNGELKEIWLSDSSHVWLNARTAITYPETFEGPQRIVHIVQGEAFFQVKHDPAHPFIVEANHNVQTRVLGTSFSVKTDTSCPYTKVAVKTGKVSVQQHATILTTLVPGQQVQYDLAQDRWQTAQIDTSTVSNWTQGFITLRDASFAKVAAVMNDLYGMQIIAADPVLEQNAYSLRIHYNADPIKLIQVICAIKHNQYKKVNKNQIIIY